MTEIQQCDARVVIDFDSVGCHLPDGHTGFHEERGDGGAIIWTPRHVGSTGYVSPRETWPDDREADAAIADADTFTEALFEIASKYEVPVTNNLPRWQEGQFLREVGEFVGDIKRAVARFADDKRKSNA